MIILSTDLTVIPNIGCHTRLKTLGSSHTCSTAGSNGVTEGRVDGTMGPKERQHNVGWYRDRDSCRSGVCDRSRVMVVISSGEQGF